MENEAMASLSPMTAAGRLRWNFFLLLSEVIVDAGAHQSEPVTVRHAGNGKVAVGEIDVEIFDLGAPARREAEFGADARGPAGTGVGFRQSECLTAQLAECQTAGAEEQNVAEGIAGPAAHCAEPRVREFPGCKCIFGAAGLDVAFEAEHPRSGLPIVTDLGATHKTRRLGQIVIDRAPGIAEIGAEIGAGPAVEIERLVDSIGSARSIRNVGRLRRRHPARGNQRHRARDQPFHLTLHATAVTAGSHANIGRNANPRGYGIPPFSDKIYRDSQVKGLLRAVTARSAFLRKCCERRRASRRMAAAALAMRGPGA